MVVRQSKKMIPAMACGSRVSARYSGVICGYSVVLILPSAKAWRILASTIDIDVNR